MADGRPLLFAGLFLPVLGWVAFNIGAPALRQIEKMGDAPAPKKGGAKKRAAVAGLTGLSAAALLAAPEAADAAQARAQAQPRLPARDSPRPLADSSRARARRTPPGRLARPHDAPAFDAHSAARCVLRSCRHLC